MRKTKAKLIMTLSVALLSVFTMGVSTFAWFQAQANVNIQTESTSTTITVSKPDDYAFYAYKGNKKYDYNGDTVINSSDFNGYTGDFSSDFAVVTSSNIGALTTLTGMYPGQSFTFCVSASNLQEDDAVSLTLDKFISNDLRKQNNSSYHRYRCGSSNVDINIGWAINLYSLPVYTTTEPDNAYQSFLTSTGLEDKFQYSYSDSYTAFDGGNPDPLSAGTYGSEANQKITPASAINVCSGTVTSGNTKAFIFYRVYFSQAESTVYQEMTDINATARYMATAEPTTRHRYFQCYESTLGAYYLKGSINGEAVGPNAEGYSLSKITNDHYQIKNVTFRAGDTFRIYQHDPVTEIGNASTWDGCGFTLANDSYTSDANNRSLIVTNAGTYTVDYYVNGENNNYVVLSSTSGSTYDSNCFQGLTFALTDMTFSF